MRISGGQNLRGMLIRRVGREGHRDKDTWSQDMKSSACVEGVGVLCEG